MAKKMLIDASHSEETRVTIVSGNKLEEFDFETVSKKQLKGNVYLARITRVEPSLQAAFVEYGGNRHGFLAFNEIHPDYYQIPAEDREVEHQEDLDDDDDLAEDSSENDVETMGGDDDEEHAKKRRPKLKRHYKIQEVIKKRQVMLIQVGKEERGNKGAAVTTYLSLAGRYCVLMPNTARGGGVSRKITNQQDRKRLKKILADIEKPDNMGIIVRTAGAERTKIEVKRDYEYTFRLWNKIREVTLKSIAPALIHEEASLIHRAIRDMYNKEIDEIIVAGDTAHKDAKAFMKELSPSHAKKVILYKDDGGIPLFQRYQVEGQLAHIYDTTAILKSGGSIVMNQTEALVAIDVNSGRATKERHIDDTALKTNLEAAEEVARQLRLRDMAGLIVIDFIDMDDNKANAQVERRLKESLRKDRARIQVGRISQFGLLEMSRQRLRPSLIEATSSICPACAGSGSVPSTEVAAMMVVRAIEEEAMRKRSEMLAVVVPSSVGFYLLNNKRKALTEIETNFGVEISISVSETLVAPAYEMSRDNGEGEEPTTIPKHNNNRGHNATENTDEDNNRRGNKRNNRNRRRNKNRGNEYSNNDDNSNVNSNSDAGSETNNQNDTDSGEDKRNNNNNRHRNRKPRREHGDWKNNNQNSNAENNQSENSPSVESQPADNVVSDNSASPKKSSRRNPRKTVNEDVSSSEISEGDKPVKKAKKATAKKATAKKATAKKSTAKKATAKKATAKKATAKKTVAKEQVAETAPKKKGWWS